MKPVEQIINEANSIILAKDKQIENLKKIMKQNYTKVGDFIWKQITDLEMKVDNLTKENEYLKAAFPKSEMQEINSELREENIKLLNTVSIINDLEMELREEKDLNKQLNYSLANSNHNFQKKIFELRRINFITLITIVIYILYKLIF